MKGIVMAAALLALLAGCEAGPFTERCRDARNLNSLDRRFASADPAVRAAAERSYQVNTGYYCDPFADPHWPN
jgi:hypothetical protein